MMNRSSRNRSGLIAVFLAFLVVALVACGSSATPAGTPEVVAPTADSPPTSTSTASNIDRQNVPPGWTPMGAVAGVDRSARLLEVLGKLPLSFKEEGVWFADYFQARESAGAPQPVSLAEFLALSENERVAYQAANRGLVPGPGLLAAIRGDIREWDKSLGFSNFSVAVAVSTGEISQNIPPIEAAYMTLEYDQAKLRQGLLDMGYVEGSANGVTFYDAPRLTLEMTRSNPLAFIAINSMKRVVLGEGTLATGGVQMIDLVPDMQRASQGDIPSLNDDPAFHALALSLAGPLSAAFLTRSTVLEPEAVSPPRYDKPDEWGDLHQWEAMAMGYGVSDGVPWLAISLFYADPDAAKADAGELTLRMSDYDSAIPLTHPELREEQLAGMPDRPFDSICGPLNATYSGDGNGSTLTMKCGMKDEFGRSIWWAVLLNMRDLGFLLP